MDRVALRSLPGIAAIEAKLEIYEKLMGDELEELRRDIDRTSLKLFGITAADTRWPPIGGLDSSANAAWNKHFEFLELEDDEFYEEEDVFWDAFGVDVTDGAGSQLQCLEVFGRQLVCALKQLHPAASLSFMGGSKSEAQIEAEAHAWGKALKRRDC